MYSSGSTHELLNRKPGKTIPHTIRYININIDIKLKGIPPIGVAIGLGRRVGSGCATTGCSVETARRHSRWHCLTLCIILSPYLLIPTLCTKSCRCCWLCPYRERLLYCDHFYSIHFSALLQNASNMRSDIVALTDSRLKHFKIRDGWLWGTIRVCECNPCNHSSVEHLGFSTLLSSLLGFKWRAQ
jgi:hypothetical protein